MDFSVLTTMWNHIKELKSQHLRDSKLKTLSLVAFVSVRLYSKEEEKEEKKGGIKILKTISLAKHYKEHIFKSGTEILERNCPGRQPETPVLHKDQQFFD